MDAITFLTYIAVMLLLGVVASAIAHKLKIPDLLILLIIGLYLGSLTYEGGPLIHFSPIFLNSLGIFTLALIVFDATAKIKLRRFDAFSSYGIKLSVASLLINAFVLSCGVYYLFDIPLPIAVLLSTLVSGTAPSTVLPLLKGNIRPFEVLRLEAILNTPLIVLFPFLIVDIMQDVAGSDVTTQAINQIAPFLTEFISGIGTGIFVGIILFKILRRTYSKLYSPLAVVVAALLSYVIAENLGGSGVVAVTSLGLFFGNTKIKQKVDLLVFESTLTKLVYVLVFIMIGTVVSLPFGDFVFLGKTFLLYLFYLVLRFIAIVLSFGFQKFTLREQIFMTMINGKGIAFAAVIFTLSTIKLEGLDLALDIAIMFLFYSIAVASVVPWLFPPEPEEEGEGKKEEKGKVGKKVKKSKGKRRK